MIENVLNEIVSEYDEKGREEVEYAFSLAKESLEGKTRENKHPFIEHPLGVARIVAKDLVLGPESVAALFLHEALRFNPELADSPKVKRFSAEITDMAWGLNKIAAIKPKETKLEADNYKHLILSYSKDPRVTLIKLADRLEVMRNIDLLPKSSQERKVMETMFLYIPIAHQLGLYNIKQELENIFFKFTEPEKYREITNKLAATEADRRKMITSFIEPLKSRIAAEGIKAVIKQRTKSAYSIWKKMQKQGVTFEGVKDLLAIRIIIDAPDDIWAEHDLCWKVYSIVTEEYKPDVNRLRDWITVPKENGYESLHTTVSDSSDHFVEVQIRTERMDRVAEKGNASHWSYKGIKEQGEVMNWLSGVRNILENGSTTSYNSFAGTLSDEVFVFTPDGTLRRFPKGATILDFAFGIHTNLGLRCSGALVDGKPASIKQLLRTGEVIEIKSSKNQKPSADWLNFVVTSKARNKIRLKLREEQLKVAAQGREMLERRLKNWKLTLEDEDIQILCKKYKLKNISDFFVAIEDGTIDVMEVKAFLASKEENNDAIKTDACASAQQSGNSSGARSGDDYIVIDGKLGSVSYQMAKCCNPIFGDEVFGFVSVKNGIRIHRMSCPNARRLIEEYPYRIQKVKWREDAKEGSFQTGIKVTAYDSSAFPALTECVAKFGGSVRSSSVEALTGRNAGMFNILIQVFVAGNSVLDKILSQMKKVRGVVTVRRTVNR